MKKVIINLNKPAKDLKGKAIEGSNLGEMLADVLAMHNEGKQALKFYGWALNLAAGKDLELDQADVNTLKEFVESSKQMTVMLSAQILLEIDCAQKDALPKSI